MRAERPLRVPLQIGTSALTSLVLTSLWFVPGSILTAIPATIMWALDFPDLGDLTGYIFIPGLVCLGLTWKYLLRARGQRPSDLMLAGDGFEIHGGLHHGERIAWAELTKVALEVGKQSKSSDEDDSDLKQLCVYRADKRFELAAAADAGEQESLSELARTLEAGRGGLREYKKRKAKQEDALELVVCPACAAVVAPVDAETATCAFCQAKVPMRDDLRQKIRDARDVSRRPDADVAKLLDQPGAERLARFLAIASVFILPAWPAVIALGTFNYLNGTFTVASVVWLLLSMLACVFGVFGLARAQLVDRTALRLVALDFGAIPQGPGKPYLCRQCHAPLDPKVEEVLVRCVFCDSSNVLGIDLRRDADVARAETVSLADALARRARERARWRGVSIGGAVLVVVAVYSLSRGVG